MDELDAVAPAFVEMAHRIVWCSVATVSPAGRPWMRILHPDERAGMWQKFVDAPAPVGYDPTIVPAWKDGPGSDAFGALRLQPWRLRVLPGTAMLTGEGRALTWSTPGT
jgi:hypothetical protein